MGAGSTNVLNNDKFRKGFGSFTNKLTGALAAQLASRAVGYFSSSKKPRLSYSKTASAKKTSTKKRKRTYSRKRRSKRYKNKKYSLPLTIREEPYKINVFNIASLDETNSNTMRHSIGTSGQNLYSNFDLVNRQFTTVTVGSTNQMFLEWGKLSINYQNLGPTNIHLWLWKFTFRNDQYNQTLPLRTIIARGASNMNSGTDNSTQPNYSLQQNQMLKDLGYLKLIKKVTMKPGEEITQDYFERMNKIFNVEKLTPPGSTSFGTLDESVQGLKGYTTFYGYSMQGSIWDVTAGAPTGPGFAHCKLGIMVTKTYKSRAFSNVVQPNTFSVTNNNLGISGASGAAQILNEETRTPLNAVLAGSLTNYA